MTNDIFNKIIYFLFPITLSWWQ